MRREKTGSRADITLISHCSRGVDWEVRSRLAQGMACRQLGAHTFSCSILTSPHPSPTRSTAARLLWLDSTGVHTFRFSSALAHPLYRLIPASFVLVRPLREATWSVAQEVASVDGSIWRAHELTAAWEG